MRPSGFGGAGASAALALLDDVHRHRLRRAALHLPPPGQERSPSYYSDRLLGCVFESNQLRNSTILRDGFQKLGVDFTTRRLKKMVWVKESLGEECRENCTRNNDGNQN